jgi:lipopolysaccharide assembly protein A
MRVLRTIPWLVLVAIVTSFMVMNVEPAKVRFWPLANDDYLHFEWPVGFIALFFFLLGFVPTWLVHLAGRWRLRRRISALEAATRIPSAALTSTQLDAVAQSGETPAD